MPRTCVRFWKLTGASDSTDITGWEGMYVPWDVHGAPAVPALAAVGEDGVCTFSARPRAAAFHSSSDGQGTLHRASNQLPAGGLGRGLDKKVEFRAIKCNLNPENAFSEGGFSPATFNDIPFNQGCLLLNRLILGLRSKQSHGAFAVRLGGSLGM